MQPRTFVSRLVRPGKHRDKEARASLLYNGFTTATSRGWLLRLTTSAPNKIIPSDEQRLVLQDVMDRCLQERDDEQQELDIRSEPSRLFLHGVPGAGKSKLLEWIRLFFEEVCGWTHGVEFVHLASQHTMTALTVDSRSTRSATRSSARRTVPLQTFARKKLRI